MLATANLRLPGVYFLPAPQPPAPALPPLDVAAFVGFAERGPLDVPLAVEDPAAYAALFGGDLALARDQNGRVVNANLPRAVASFFENGGRRCYVVRVAGAQPAAARFVLPRTVALTADGDARLAPLSASSVGRWAAGLRLAARLRVTPLPASAFSVTDNRHLAWQTGSAPLALGPGDVLRLSFDDGQQWLAPVSSLQRPTDTGGPVVVQADQAWALLGAPVNSLPPEIGRVFKLTIDGLTELAAGPLILVDGRFALVLATDVAAGLAPGDILLLESTAGDNFLLAVEALQTGGTLGSPLQPAVQALAGGLLQLNPSTGGTGLPSGTLARVDRLRFDILLRLDDAQRPTLAELAFNAGHPRFWGDVVLLESSMLPFVPTPVRRQDENQVAATNGKTPLRPTVEAGQRYRDLQAGTRSEPPRDENLQTVALAGLLAPVAPDPQITYLPLGMLEALGESDYYGPDEAYPGSDDLDSYGLATASRFLDGYLVPLPGSLSPSAASLLASAFDRYYVQNRRLLGLHSLLFIDEVALVCLPEAVHRNWAPTGGTEALPFTPPQPPAAQTTPCPPTGPFLDCDAPPAVTGVDPDHGTTHGGTIITVQGSGFIAGTTVSVGGVAATAVQITDVSSLRCTVPAATLAGPVTVEVSNANGSGSLANAFTYEQPLPARPLPGLEPPADFDLATSPLLPLQQALIVFCQARADVVGILTLPQHFEKRDCIGWQQALRSNLQLPRQGTVVDDVRDLADLSYVAVYHPWLLVADDAAADGLRAITCDGAVCGMIAARERARQVWVAPANTTLNGVLGLEPAISIGDWADLFDLQFNLVRAEPKDFRVMSAHTLADDQTLLQVSVRRLMILLRKAALAHGMDFVFETNHEYFREAVRVLLLGLLRTLFAGGAFAGPTPETSYRVITDSSVNTPQSIDEGRFIALIQVAPSQPLEFLTVVLTRSSEGVLQSTEA